MGLAGNGQLGRLGTGLDADTGIARGTPLIARKDRTLSPGCRHILNYTRHARSEVAEVVLSETPNHSA